MAVADKLTKLANDISDAYDTIETMGGTLPTDKNTDSLPDAISTIPQGSPTPTGDFRVRFFDIDGTILKEEWVNKGEDATPPANPTYDSTLLTFAEWNNPYTNITDDLDIGAVYDTKNDEVAILKIFFNYNITKTMTIYYRNTNVEGTIDWGDGTTDTLEVSSSRVQLDHTYEKNFYEAVTIKITGTNGFSFNSYNNNSSFNSFEKNITAIYLGTKYGHGASENIYVLYPYSLEVLSMEKNATKMFPKIGGDNLLNIIICPTNAVYTTQLAAYKLKYFVNSIKNVDSGIYNQFRTIESINSQKMTFVKQYHFRSMWKLEFLNLKNVTSLSSNVSQNRNIFSDCYNLKELYFEKLEDIPSDQIFQGCHSLKNIIINRNSVTTLSSAYAFTLPDSTSSPTINKNCKIYVPDNLLNNYKTATYWSTIADRIKPMSELPTDSYFYRYVKDQINN